MSRIVVVGAGYVGSLLAARLASRGHEVFDVRRSGSTVEGVASIRADLSSPASLRSLPQSVDIAVFTAAPDAADEASYRAIYVDGLRHVIEALGEDTRVVFTSSTAVYGHDDGSIVDERSPTAPKTFRGRILLEAEELADTSVRLAGIYGPGRSRALDAVLRADARYRPGRFVNLIHRDDAAEALAHVATLDRPERVYVGADEEPVASEVLYGWLASRTRSAAPAAMAKAGLNKRCSSARLRASGFAFVFPTFREGYGSLIEKKKEFGPNR